MNNSFIIIIKQMRNKVVRCDTAIKTYTERNHQELWRIKMNKTLLLLN